jgi:GldM C-terminal domain
MKFAISILPVFVFLNVYSQVTIKNMSLVKPDTNILLQHIDNMIKVLGTNQKTHIISRNGSSVSAYDNNTFGVKLKTLSPDTLLVYAGKELILKKIFTVDTIPNPGIQLGYIQHDTATVQEILANKGLNARYKGSLFQDTIRILSFSTTFIGPDGHTLNIYIPPIEGNMLTDEQVAIIKQLRKNSKILFDDIIIVINSNPKKRRLAPFAITIR